MVDLLGIIGSRSKPSKTYKAVEIAVKAAEESFDIETKMLHLADYTLDVADGRALEEYKGDTAKVLKTIIGSKSYIIGTPVYRGSCTGILKNLLDLIPRGKWQADVAPLENSAVGLVATGATQHHFLSISQELGPLLNFFGAYPVGSGVYIDSDSYANGAVSDKRIIERLELTGKATHELTIAIESSNFLDKLPPQF